MHQATYIVLLQPDSPTIIVPHVSLYISFTTAADCLYVPD